MTSNSSTTYGSEPTTPNTTFVQADPSTFRSVVQQLTGASNDPSAHKLPLTLPSRLSSAHRPTTTATTAATKKPIFKLHERRSNNLQLNIGVSDMFHNNHYIMMNNVTLGGSTRGEMVNLIPSPVSPLEFLARGSPRTPKSPQQEEEQRVVVEKGFYLHPTTPKASNTTPQLLPLFPLHSPNSNHNSSS
ncbi:hypothetical protein TanjilG_01142 [Lupinus angustifolius]|uniref:VQ domain-containing protein n=1 Tax=Lupinus angustifolius TaxID=3871 RepID=A0A1J7HET8_LUPAN|nr:PREDICTED: VQ motif-containing protein 11-like [Lupinus angustifolius]OIW04946.1 hypothetical protein TanjilG_01142 [Lupinus angustifolius]